MDKRKAWLIGLCVAVAAAALFLGYATFDQWAAFVGGLMGSV